ncbi:MAG: putative dinucleotide-binding enzyme [Rhodothermales bacterium]|jgi:predicted dinucleotide-binding enzyme
MKRVGVLGSGVVGTVLSNGFLKHGYSVRRGSRSPEKFDEWLETAGPHASGGTFKDAAAFGDLVVLAVNGTSAKAVLEALSPGLLDGKVVIDTTNPVLAEAPDNGVIRYASDINQSLMETLQAARPEARFVKAFSCVGSAFMVNPDFPGGPPTMFICGNDESARDQVSGILDDFGWEVEDMGMAESARAIEPLAMLYCIPGFREHRWNHAFKILKTNG